MKRVFCDRCGKEICSPPISDALLPECRSQHLEMMIVEMIDKSKDVCEQCRKIIAQEIYKVLDLRTY